MPHSIRSSNASAPSRLPTTAPGAPAPSDASGRRFARRPSRLLATGLAALGGLAAFATLASEMPRAAAWPLALAAFAHGAWLARREARTAPGDIVLATGGGACTVDGRAVESLRVRWRGPIAFVQWREADGRRGGHVFWPDTLPAARRRELRLAAPAPAPAGEPASMAP